MNDNAALNLIRNTFENSFDRERFLIFAKNLFHFLDTDTFIYRGNLIPDAYDTHIKTLERLGKYEDVDGHNIEVLAVCLNKQSSLERARTLQRNFIAWYLNGSRGGVTKDAALVAFYTKDSDDWRLSLVKMDYHLGESKAGKIKAITELTPARRFSFLVGASENTHTAQKQLLPIIKDTEFKPRLTDLESAFSVEVVTKDFFEKYKKLFLDTKEALDTLVAKDAKIKADFQEKNIDTADFAKKLLGQIVFLYFLQKKGWFGVSRDSDWGTGPKDFLRRLFEKQLAEYDNFFNNILEPLFYEALAVERPDNFYSRFDCKIPFLNGGLFDPLGNYDWVHTDIRLPDELFSNNRKTKEGDTGDGILDVFDRYNFTVKEDEPLEREVAVDPEMLGKVFENLLEVKDRKSKGTYYTPREIVHYMCQESLINYLLTELNGKVDRDDIETLIRLGETAIEHDKVVLEHGEEKGRYTFKLPSSIRDNASLLDEKLEKIHVCDPAVGSGAFLVGMMTEVIRVRSVLTNYLSDNGRSIYDFKRHAIQNCLYGVDIDPGAVEIAKLRLRLSLIVDEQDIKQIKPLPNLDYKIMQGNSLLEEYEGVKLNLDGYDQPQQIKFDEVKTATEILSEKLTDLRKKFFKTAQKSEKDTLKEEIEELTWQLIEASLREQGKLSLLPEIVRFKKANIKPFFLWKLNFSDVFENNKGFEVIIANPPYMKERENKQVFEIVNNSGFGKKYHQGKMDYWYYFLHKAIDLVKTDGVICYITSRYWINSLGAKKLIERIRGELSFVNFVDIGKLKVFDNVAGQHMIALYLKNKAVKEFIYKKLENDLSDLNKNIETNNLHIRTLSNEEVFKDSQISLSKDPLNYVGTVTLGGIANVIQGVVQNPDKVSRKTASKYGLTAGEGVFVLGRNELEKLKINKGEKKFVRDFFDENDIQKYSISPKKAKFLLYITKTNCTDIFQYPNIAAHLKKYKKIMDIRRETKKGLNLWFHLHWPREEKYFECSKIVIPAMFDRVKAGYQEESGYFGLSTNIITQKNPDYDLRFLVAILNSSLANYWFHKHGKARGVGVDIGVNKLKEIPIKKTSISQQKPFIGLVNKIIILKKSALQEDNKHVQDYEEQLDQFVYKLYGLTSKEVATVENINTHG